MATKQKQKELTYKDVHGLRYYNVVSHRTFDDEEGTEKYFLSRSTAISFARTKSRSANIYEVWVYGFNPKNEEVLRLWYQDGGCVGDYIGDEDMDADDERQFE